MKYLWTVLAGTALVAVYAAYVITRQAVPAPVVISMPQESLPANDAAQAARLLRMEAQIGDLQARLERAEHRAIAAERSGSDAMRGEADAAARPLAPLDSPAPPSALPQIPRGELVAEEHAYSERAVAQLEGELAREDLDGGWAGNFQADLDQGLKSPSFAATRVTDVECKRSLCRVAFAHDSEESEAVFFEHILELPVMANTEAYYTRQPNADGSSSLVMYIAREGQRLPLPQRTGQLGVN